MPSLLVEPPKADSQLCFPWLADAEYSEFRVGPSYETASPESFEAEPSGQNGETRSVQGPAPEPSAPDLSAPDLSAPDLSAPDSSAPDHAEDVVIGIPASPQRLSEPVRIGSVMIKLLKRYGISDAEIAEGLENYAAKQAAISSPTPELCPAV